jgi:ribosomal protein S21
MLVVPIVNNDVLAAIKTLKKVISKEYVREYKLKSFFYTVSEKFKINKSQIIKRKIEARQNDILMGKEKMQKSTPLKIYTDYRKDNFLVKNNFSNSDFVFFQKNDTRNTYNKKEISLNDADKIN